MSISNIPHLSDKARSEIYKILFQLLKPATSHYAFWEWIFGMDNLYHVKPRKESWTILYLCLSWASRKYASSRNVLYMVNFFFFFLLFIYKHGSWQMCSVLSFEVQIRLLVRSVAFIDMINKLLKIMKEKWQRN